jgi:transposase-like protein
MKTINQIALEHDVHPMQVRQWKRDIQDQVVDVNYPDRSATTILAGGSGG